MLKRLSFTGSEAPHLAPPSPLLLQQTGRTSPQQPFSTSPRASTPTSPGLGYFPLQQAQQPLPLIDRTTLHKSLQSLSTLLVALDEFRDLVARLAKAEKKVGKASKELASGFVVSGSGAEGGGRNLVVGKALIASAAMWETLSEVDVKLAKAVQKEYETANDLAGKFFKKIAKEEKTFDDSLSSLDTKVRNATLQYEKSRPRAPRNSASEVAALTASHDKYMTTLSSLSSQIASLKQSHGESTGEKREKAAKEVARILCALSETAWKNRVEGTRRGGEKVGECVARGVFCETGMPGEGAEEQREVAAIDTAIGIRGPRPLPSSDQPDQPQTLDPTLFTQAAGFPPNTYLVQIPGLQPTQQSSQQQFLATPGGESPTPSQQRGPSPAPSQQRSLSPSRSQLGLNNNYQRSATPSDPNNYQHRRQASPSPSRINSFPQSLPQTSQPLSSTYNQPQSPHSVHDDSNASSRSTLHTLSPFSSECDNETFSNNGRGRTVSGGNIDGRSSRAEDNGGNSRAEPIRSNSGENRGQTYRQEFEWERRGTPGFSDLERGEEVRRPEPRYGFGGEKGGVELSRDESTNSERNFVARMKERYAEEKRMEEARKEQPARSNSRVSNLAQRYSSPAPPQHHQSFPSSSSNNTNYRPSHKYSNSMQPLYNTGRSNTIDFLRANEFGERERWTPSSTNYGSPPRSEEFEPPRPRFANDQPRAYSRQSNPPNDPHPSVCGCEECTSKNYKGQSNTTADEEGKIQAGLRSIGRPAGSRRLSMPVIFGGAR